LFRAPATRRRSRTFQLDQLAGARHETVEEPYDARLLQVRRGLADRKQPGTLYDGFIDYGCYVSLLLGGDASSRPRARGTWLNSPKGVPPDGFSLVRRSHRPHGLQYAVELDKSTLHDRQDLYSGLGSPRGAVTKGPPTYSLAGPVGAGAVIWSAKVSALSSDL
jgi:hypothetical protein